MQAHKLHVVTTRANPLRWQKRATAGINGNIGALTGTIEHHFHGSKTNRAYQSRWDILSSNDFDPDEDLKRNIW